MSQYLVADDSWPTESDDVTRLESSDLIGSHLRKRVLGDEEQRPSREDFTVIGEAVTQLSEAIKSAHPDVEWSYPVRLHNRIVNGYWSVDLEVFQVPFTYRDEPLEDAGSAAAAAITKCRSRLQRECRCRAPITQRMRAVRGGWNAERFRDSGRLICAGVVRPEPMCYIEAHD